MLKLCIDKVDNGYVLTPDPSTEKDPQVFEIDDENEAESFTKVLWAITEYFDHLGSRYDKKRISITTKKGDKWEPKEAGAE
jgi:hypothetical protein